MSNSMKNNDIDFIDFVVVVARYRVLISVSLIITIIGSIVGYYLYPAWKYEKDRNIKRGEAICRIVAGPAIHATGTKYNLELIFDNPSSYLKALRKSGFNEIGGINISNNSNDQVALNWIHENFPIKITDDFKMKYPKLRNYNSQIISISFFESDSDKAVLFLSNLVEIMEDKIMNDIIPQCEAIVDGYEDSLKVNSVSDDYKYVMANNYHQYNIAKQILNNKLEALWLFDKPYYIENSLTSGGINNIKSSYVIKAVIITMLILFLTILLALLLNLINYIKNDNCAMTRIRKSIGKDKS